MRTKSNFLDQIARGISSGSIKSGNVKRRIVFSNYDDLENPYYAGGGAQAIHEIARRLVPSYEVTVLTGKYPGSRDMIKDGVAYRRIGLAPAGPKLGQLIFQALLPLVALRARYDIWVESLTPPFSTAFLQCFTRKPVVVLTQNLAGQAMARKYRLPFHWVERLGLKTYRHAVALSSHIRTQILAANPRVQTVVIPNGIAPEALEQSPSTGGDAILFLGRIDVQQKGLDLLLEAYARLAAENPPPLLIAGSGVSQDEQFVSQRIKQLGMQDRVQLLGKVQGEAKRAAMARAMIFVMPSRFEGFPLTLLEAFCCKLPTVVFDIADLKDVAPECCVKVEAFNVEAFARALRELCADASARERLGEAARRFAGNYSWDRIAERYREFLDGLH